MFAFSLLLATGIYAFRQHRDNDKGIDAFRQHHDNDKVMLVDEAGFDNVGTLDAMAAPEYSYEDGSKEQQMEAPEYLSEDSFEEQDSMDVSSDAPDFIDGATADLMPSIEKLLTQIGNDVIIEEFENNGQLQILVGSVLEFVHRIGSDPELKKIVDDIMEIVARMENDSELLPLVERVMKFVQRKVNGLDLLVERIMEFIMRIGDDAEKQELIGNILDVISRIGTYAEEFLYFAIKLHGSVDDTHGLDHFFSGIVDALTSAMKLLVYRLETDDELQLSVEAIMNQFEEDPKLKPLVDSAEEFITSIVTDSELYLLVDDAEKFMKMESDSQMNALGDRIMEFVKRIASDAEQTLDPLMIQPDSSEFEDFVSADDNEEISIFNGDDASERPHVHEEISSFSGEGDSLTSSYREDWFPLVDSLMQDVVDSLMRDYRKEKYPGGRIVTGKSSDSNDSGADVSDESYSYNGDGDSLTSSYREEWSPFKDSSEFEDFVSADDNEEISIFNGDDSSESPRVYEELSSFNDDDSSEFNLPSADSYEEISSSNGEDSADTKDFSSQRVYDEISGFYGRDLPGLDYFPSNGDDSPHFMDFPRDYYYGGMPSSNGDVDSRMDYPPLFPRGRFVTGESSDSNDSGADVSDESYSYNGDDRMKMHDDWLSSFLGHNNYGIHKADDFTTRR